MIRVLLVDDDRLVCAHLRTILTSAGDITVVGEAAGGAEGVAAAEQLRPDVVLMDLVMPGMDGVTATRRITALPMAPRVVILTVVDIDERIDAALRAGAVGFLLKALRPYDLLTLVRAVAAGHAVLSPVALRRVVGGRSAATEDGAARMGSLSARELDVLTEMIGGASNSRIARTLSMAEATVKGHVSRILTKLNCENRTQAVILAQRYVR